MPPSWEELAVPLDHTDRLIAAVRSAYLRGVRRVVLVVAEEGSSHTREMLGRCHRLVTVASVPAASQRGLAPAVAASIALERLRFATLLL